MRLSGKVDLQKFPAQFSREDVGTSNARRRVLRCKRQEIQGQLSMRRRRRPGNETMLQVSVRVVSRVILRTMRWIFLALGALTASSVLFIYLYSVNESVYDPSLFAIGVGGLFAAACG